MISETLMHVFTSVDSRISIPSLSKVSKLTVLSRMQIQADIKKKERAIEILSRRYITGKIDKYVSYDMLMCICHVFEL